MSNSTKAKACLQEIIELFKTGNVPKALSVVVIPPQANIPSAKWSWGNRILQFMSDTSDARGYRQWQEAGRQVKKGSKSFYILGPNTKKVPSTDDNGKPTDKIIVTGFHAIPVFRCEDTNGKPLPHEPNNPPPLFDVAERLGLQVSYQTFAGRFYGCYKKESKKIILATHEIQTFFHELAHAAHHKLAGDIKGGQVPYQEIIAELTAATLANLYCPEANLGYSFGYITEYAKRSKKTVERACLAVLNTTGKVLDEILNNHAQAESDDQAA